MKELFSPPTAQDDREGGFICLHRQIMSSAVWTLPESQFKVFMTVLLMANYRDTEVVVRGKPVVIRRGQLLISHRTLSERSGTSRGCCERALGTLWRLGVLRSDPVQTGAATEAASERTPHVVTVVNYERYQSKSVAPEAATEADSRARAGHEQSQEQGRSEQRNKGTRRTTAELPLGASQAGQGKREVQEGKQEADQKTVWEMMERVYSELRRVAYPRMSGKDAVAVKRLRDLGGGDAAEIERRWRAGLNAPAGWNRCECFMDLADQRRWGALGGARPGGRAPAAAPVGSQAEHGETGFVDVKKRAQL